MLAILAGLPLRRSARAESKPQEIKSPLWRLDLRQFGYAAPYQRAVDGEPFSPHTSWLTFVGDRRLVVLFPSYEGNRKRFAAVPFRLHILLLDASNGQTIATRLWQAKVAPVEVRATGAGDILVQSGTHIGLFSSSLQEVGSLDLPATSDGMAQDWSMLLSPSGHSFFLESTSLGPRTLKLIDLATLSEIRFWDNTSGVGAVSDHLLAGLRKGELCIRSVDSPWREIHAITACLPGVRARFLTDDTVLVAGCKSFTVLRADGEVLFEKVVPKDYCVYPEAVASADGTRVAIKVGRLKGVNIPALDLGRSYVPQQLAVYDTKTQEEVGRMRLGYRTGLALSPDGSMLVHADEGILQLFRLLGAKPTH